MTSSDPGNNNFRSHVFNDSSYGSLPTAYTNEVLRTPYAGNVRSMTQPPPLPQPPMQMSQPQYGGMNNSGMFGSYGGGFGGAYGGGYGGGYGGAYGMYNRFANTGGYGTDGGMNINDPEYRFIQLAEASSRPAFNSIESLVAAIGNIAAMLDSTFFAMTSSFRAVLGVAANFGRLRGVFAQFWQTFAIFRGLRWLYQKILYWMKLSNVDPTKRNFNQAVADSLNNVQQNGPPLPHKGQSPWPVLAFLSFIFTAPYLIMKLLGSVATTAREEARNPIKWVRPIETVALYDFQARNASEISITNGQRVIIAPKEIQNSQMLLNTGWALATIDGKSSGLVPLNYVKSPQQMREEKHGDNFKPFLQPNSMQNVQIPIHHVDNHNINELMTEPPIQQQEQFPTVASERRYYQSEAPVVEGPQQQQPQIIPQPEVDVNSLSLNAFAPPPASTMTKSHKIQTKKE